MFYRILANFIIFFSALFLPWWITFFIAIGTLFFTNSFYEIFFWGFLADALYGEGSVSSTNFPFAFSTTALFLFLAISYLKKEVRFRVS